MKNVIYFEQFLAGMFLFKGNQISFEEIGDIINSFHSATPFHLEAKEDVLYNLIDFVDVDEDSFKLKEGLSLKSKIVGEYSLEEHLILNTGGQVYDYLHGRYRSDEELGNKPYQKAMSKYRKC